MRRRRVPGARAGWRAVSVLLAIACLASAASAQENDPSRAASVLYFLGTEDLDLLEAAAARGAPPVCAIDGYSLAWGPPEPAASLKDLGVAFEILGPRRSDRAYAVVFIRGRTPSDPGEALAGLGSVLHRGRSTAVLEYDPAVDERLWRSYSITRVPERPMHPAAFARSTIAKAPAEIDPLLLSLIEQVGEARLFETVLQMQNLAPRISPGPGAFQTGEWIRAEFLSYGLVDVSFFDYNHWSDNVVAVQPGKRNPEEIYVIGGHYDSYSRDGSAPGADDNASGTTGVLEAARILAPHEFDATIVYIAFSGEEQGLVGSNAWAEDARQRGLDIRGMINLDMLGYVATGHSADLDLISNAQSQALRDFIVATTALYLPDHPVVDGALSGGNSDHYPFWMNGYPAVFFFEDAGSYSPYIHTASDVIGTSMNDFPFMRRNVQTAFASLASLARPLRVRIEHDPIVDPAYSAGGYPVIASIRSVAPLLEDSLRVWFRVDGGERGWLDLSPGDSSGVYVARIPACSTGSLVDYAIRARDIEGRTAWDPPQWPALTHRFVIGLTAAFEDGFEIDRGWSAGEEDDTAERGRWERAVPVGTGAQPAADARGDSSGFCYLTANGTPGGEIGEADVDGGRTTLTSPRIDLEHAVRVQVEYARWFVDETTDDDTLEVLASNDDGRSWVALDRVTRGGRRWRIARHEQVEALLAPSDSMRFRFIAQDVGLPSLVEAAIDDFRVLAAFVEPGPEPPDGDGGPGLTLLWPVPFGRDLSIGYTLASEAAARLHVYDLQGRLVARLDGIPQGPGPHTFRWEGADAEGRSVASGAYFVELISDDGMRSTARVVKIEGSSPKREE